MMHSLLMPGIEGGKLALVFLLVVVTGAQSLLRECVQVMRQIDETNSVSYAAKPRRVTASSIKRKEDLGMTHLVR
jgi:hypothetical protein